MKPIVKKFLTASLVYLLLGLLAQTVTIFDVWLGFNPLAYTAVAVTEQLLLIGWLTQLGLALIYDRWSFPSASLSQTIFSLFNLGLPLTLLGQPGLAMFGLDWWGGIAAFGGLLQLFAAILLAHSLWKNFSNS